MFFFVNVKMLYFFRVVISYLFLQGLNLLNPPFDYADLESNN
ncbi:MAG: hypothetical protein H6Q20_2300 [Bacteroidetes bacterium]|jgi:hypothetical protein|nr:hypothetical protein [Bacteroidota bacterium]